MIPAPFEYVRAASLDEAVAALAERGEDAKVLAGGHSLLPLMKLRLAYPSALVDVTRVAELTGVSEEDGALVIGAATTHDAVAHDALVRAHCGLLAEVSSVIGDAQVRHRGTFGGAIAHGDCAGDLPAAVLALDAELLAAGPGGRRSIPAAEFFTGYLETALAPDEVLVGARVPKLDGDWGYRYEKLNRVAQAWAIAGACALVRRDGDGTGIAEARVGLVHMGPVPLRATATEATLAGADRSALAEAAAAAAEGTDPPADVSGDADYRRHLARVLTRRALVGALA